jgi:hypothetical protein
MLLKGEVLLAPIPVAHIAAARDTAFLSGGRVAFGSGNPTAGGQMWEFFAQLPKQTPSLIYVSTTGMNDSNKSEYVGLRFSHVGLFDGYETDESKILDLRPQTALESDDPHQVYWILKEFKRLDPSEEISFSAVGIGDKLIGPKLKKLK